MWWLALAYAVGPVPVQGSLTGADGAPLEGDHAVEARLYTDGGSPAWTASLTVSFAGGAFSADLSGVPASVLQSDTLSLSLVVDGGAESAQVPVGWAPRAVHAAQAAELACDGCVAGTEIANTSVSPGTYGLATLTVDADGRLTAASAGAVATGAGLSGAGTSVAPLALANTAVTAGNYTLANLSVDATGRITAASNGALAPNGVTAGTYALATVTVDASGRVTSASNGALPTSGVTPGTYALGGITVDAFGRITSASNGDFEGVKRDCLASGQAGSQTFTSGAWSTCAALTGATSNPARSCLEVRTARPTAPSGTYAIDPDAAGSTFGTINVHCDMVTDGGGWTLCYAADNTTVPTSTVTGWHTRSNTTGYTGGEYARNCQAMTSALGNLARTARVVYRDVNVDVSGQTTTLIGQETPPPALTNGNFYEFDMLQGPVPVGIEIASTGNPGRGHCFDDTGETHSWGRATQSTSCWLNSSSTGWYSGLVAVEYWLR